MASPAEARSSVLLLPAPDHPGPFLRLDHSSDQAQRAAESLSAGWESFERRRRWLFALAPALALGAAAGGLLDLAMGFGVRLATWYAPILIAAAPRASAGASANSHRRLRSKLSHPAERLSAARWAWSELWSSRRNGPG